MRNKIKYNKINYKKDKNKITENNYKLNTRLKKQKQC